MITSPEKSIFLAALEKDTPVERDAFLSDACAGDTRLRAEVEELLRAHDRADNVLDDVPAGVVAVREGLEAAHAINGGAPPGATADFSPIAERPGTVIGPYKLMEQIGEGGFGLVFVAEQQQPVRRRVALKVIKPGMDTRDVIARFEAERQALAMMDHPNIAKVFDAGSTGANPKSEVRNPKQVQSTKSNIQNAADPIVSNVSDSNLEVVSDFEFRASNFPSPGRPYFVMELVRGVPITEFCDQQQLDTRERLELFVTVCHAVQHAHQKGVIHRDIKPSNVLVTLHDGTPVVKVIDFGVAKAVGQQLTDKTIYTRFAQMIGTPLYMSPEQAEMSGLDIDTRSDIYSLGVLLYELLTGTTPFDGERLKMAGFDELRRIIREEEPPRPSTRLTTLGHGLSTVAAQRKTAPRKLSALVQGDLDWIVMKALEKDRGRRYETAAALAADAGRYLREQPIEARPPSPLYRFRKFARRHKVTITTVSLVAAAMIFGTGISIWQANRAVAERDEKERALEDAVRARNGANAARNDVEQFAERLKQANILITSGRAHADADRWPAAHADYTRATELQPNYYHVWVERGSLYVRLGLWKLAASDYAGAVELGAPADGPAMWGVPALFAFVGDHQHYRQFCAQAVQQFAESPDDFSIVDLRGCVLAPDSVPDPAALAERAEKLLADAPDWKFGPRPFGDRPPTDRPNQPRDDSVDRPPSEPPYDPQLPRNDDRGRPPGAPPAGRDRRADDDPDRAPGPPPRPEGFRNGPARPFGPGRGMTWIPRGVSLYVAGLAHYRAGNFDQAVARLHQSLTDDPGWPGRSIPYPALAMAYHRSGRADEAREALASAEHAIDEWTESMLEGPAGTMPIPWFDWVECLVLYREAKILLTGFAPPDDPRLTTQRDRALAAIRDSATGQ